MQNRSPTVPDRAGKPNRICPGCGGVLRETAAEANYGRYLILDQCPDCGGIWFDRWELLHLRPEEAGRLDPVDRTRLLQPAPLRRGAHQCPGCGSVLKPFRDPTLPKELFVMTCGPCGGMWLNRGELRKYADHRRAVRGRKGRASPTSGRIPMPERMDGPDRIAALQKLGRALSTQARPDAAAALEADEGDINGAALAKDLGLILAQVLLRMILKI